MVSFVSYSVDNDRKFRDGLKRAGEVTKDLRIPFALILSDFYRSEQSIFKLKGPGQYPDFKNGGSNSAYALQKEKAVGFKYPLLLRTGRAAASLLSKDAPGSVASIGPTEMVFGSTVEYLIYHQSDEPRSKIPQRKVLFIGPEAPQFANSDQQGRLERWLNIMNDYVLKKMKNSGAFKNG